MFRRRLTAFGCIVLLCLVVIIVFMGIGLVVLISDSPDPCRENEEQEAIIVPTHEARR